MKRNVVLVTIDSLRADHCSYWGYDRETTPTLDRLAEEGIVFENAIAPGPKTPESMPVMFTGAFPTTEFETSELDSWRDQIYPHMARRETIAERFSNRGYTTAAFTPNGFTSEYFGFDAGFDQFEDFLDTDYRPGLEVPNVVRAMFKWIQGEGTWKLWERYYEQVARFLREAPEPYFLWVFLLDVHSPYLVPRQYRTENSWVEMMYANWRRSKSLSNESVKHRLISAYDDSIRYADEFLRRLLEDDGTDPVVVVHSDHGEAFGEHGIQGHHRFLFEENVHVPLVIGNIDADVSIESPTSLQQLPCILDAVSSGGATEIADFQARDTAEQNPVVFRSREGNRIGVRFGRFKSISHGEKTALYDLDSDPGENHDISQSHPNVAELLEAAVERHRTNNTEKVIISETASDLHEELFEVGRV